MSYHNNARVKLCVEELGVLLNGPGVDQKAVSTALRLLRPAKGGVEHIAAIRARIRQSILNNYSNEDAQLELNKFEKHCDAVQRINPKLLNPFLQVLEPLSFAPERQGPAGRLTDFTSKSTNDLAFTGGNGETAKDNDVPRDGVASVHAGIAAAAAATVIQQEIDVDAANVVWVPKDVERILLIDVIYILQGIAGKHIKYDAKTESYVIDPSLKLNATVRDTVLCLCELGWLYGRVAAYLKSTMATPADTTGVIVQAFCFALQEELNDYYRLLAVLEQELQITPQSGNQALPSTAVRPANLLAQRNRSDDNGQRNGASPEDMVNNGASGLTLLRLRAWLQEPIERMCQMARMVDGALSLRGGALVSRLYGHTQHGDPATRGLVRRVMDSVCAPLYTVLSRWVLYGELQDPHKEFFVKLNDSGDVRNIWRDTYSLQHAMIPAYFSHTMAQKILSIGKSINFIRLCLQKLPRLTARDEAIDASKSNPSASAMVRKSLRSVNKNKVLGPYGQVRTLGEEAVGADEEGSAAGQDDQSLAQLGVKVNAGGSDSGSVPAATMDGAAGKAKRALNMADVLGGIVTPEVQRSLQTLRFGGEAALQDIVYRLSASIDAQLLNLVMSRFYVQTHLLALKKFMLLGQGDFVTCLMDGVGPELKRRANQLFRHNLTGILEGALRASNAQFEPSYVQDRIGIRLLEASPGDSGWEIFSLDYAIDAPLNAVVHVDCISKYRIAFHMLWRLKRVEWSLTTTWKQHTMFNHSNRAYIPPALRAVFHRCYLNRATMMHVVNNLCAFLMFEVLETSWQSLQETVARARCLDDVITAHDAYLSEVLDRALLAPHHEELNGQVQRLLQVVLRFCTLEETLIADAMASIARSKVASSAMDERNKKERKHGDSPMAASSPSPAVMIGLDGVPEAVVARIDETVKEYGRQFDTLMGMLKEQGEQAGEILRFLTFRLDFNDFHQQQRAVGGHVGLTATPPAHLKTGASRPGFFAEPQFGESGSDRLAYANSHGAGGGRGDGGSAVTPQRSDSPTFGFSGPEAWTVADGADGAGARAPPAGLGAKAAVKPRASVAGSSKYMR